MPFGTDLFFTQTDFVAPEVEAGTPFMLQVTATDSGGASDTCQVLVVTVRNIMPFTLDVSQLDDPSQRLQ